MPGSRTGGSRSSSTSTAHIQRERETAHEQLFGERPRSPLARSRRAGSTRPAGHDSSSTVRPGDSASQSNSWHEHRGRSRHRPFHGDNFAGIPEEADEQHHQGSRGQPSASRYGGHSDSDSDSDTPSSGTNSHRRQGKFRHANVTEVQPDNESSDDEAYEANLADWEDYERFGGRPRPAHDHPPQPSPRNPSAAHRYSERPASHYTFDSEFMDEEDDDVSIPNSSRRRAAAYHASRASRPGKYSPEMTEAMYTAPPSYRTRDHQTTHQPRNHTAQHSQNASPPLRRSRTVSGAHRDDPAHEQTSRRSYGYVDDGQGTRLGRSSRTGKLQWERSTSGLSRSNSSASSGPKIPRWLRYFTT